MKRTVILAAVAVGMAWPGAFAEEATDDAEVHVKYRDLVMGSIRANMGAIGHILKNRLPHQANIAVHAQALHQSSTLIESAFKNPAMTEDSESLPAVWENWEGFVAESKKLQDASQALAEAAASGDMAVIGPAVRAVGQTCGSCHDGFRKPHD